MQDRCSDMTMDLDKSRWEKSGLPTLQLFLYLKSKAWQRRESYKEHLCG